MSHYRKIDVRIWNDKKFMSLSPDSKLIFLMVLTHPNMTSLGIIRATVEGLSSELEPDDEERMKDLSKGFRELFRKGLLKVDRRARILMAPNFIKYNKPENPNVLKNMGKAYDSLPECKLKDELVEVLRGICKGYTEPFRKAFHNSFERVT